MTPTATYECGRQSLGCWRDSSNRAITGGVRFNSQIDPVKSCEKYASENGFTVFAGKPCSIVDLP